MCCRDKKLVEEQCSEMQHATRTGYPHVCFLLLRNTAYSGCATPANTRAMPQKKTTTFRRESPHSTDGTEQKIVRNSNSILNQLLTNLKTVAYWFGNCNGSFMKSGRDRLFYFDSSI